MKSLIRRNGISRDVPSWFPVMIMVLTLIFFGLDFSYAQSDIPIGQWRIHPSYHALNSVASSADRVFGAAANGVMVLDRADNSLNTFSKLDGLSGTTITCMTYALSSKVLLIGYRDGRFDVIDEDNRIIGFDPTSSAAFAGSKMINNVYVNNANAYLTTDYGVVVFDLERLQIKETWRDLGVMGETLAVNQCTMVGDTIFLATDYGVVAGDIRENLLDFSNWKRFNEGTFAGPVNLITYFNDAVYVTINNSGVYSYGNGSWTVKDYLKDSSFVAMHSSVDKMMIAQADRLWEVSVDDQLTEIVSPLIQQPRSVYVDHNNQIWIGDGVNGLISGASGDFVNYLPNSPSNEKIRNLEYNKGGVYAFGGGYSDARVALGNNGRLDVLSDGIWSVENSTLSDLTDLAFNPKSNKTYRSSFGFGIDEKDDKGAIRIFDETNSPLINTNVLPGFVNVTSLESSSDGIWVANYGAEQSLHLFMDNDTWESFSFPATSSRYPLDLVTDWESSVWMALDPANGGGIFVFNKTKNTSVYLTDVAGSGGLPARSVHSMALDRDGMVWVGTDQGVAFFINPSEVFSPGIDAIKPIFESRFLLRDDKVTAIAVDGGNRKWMGTERGVWLFNSTGETLIHNFTAENSPLLSDVIHDIAINDLTGEVFFATDEGLVSFRSDATESTLSFQAVKVFPNPVTADFAGTVGITGLATDAGVKITDVSGKLVWQSQANGGTATWRVQDYNGRRVATGVYLIFSTTQDGSQSVVAKIAVVD